MFQAWITAATRKKKTLRVQLAGSIWTLTFSPEGTARLLGVWQGIRPAGHWELSGTGILPTASPSSKSILGPCSHTGFQWGPMSPLLLI